MSKKQQMVGLLAHLELETAGLEGWELLDSLGRLLRLIRLVWIR